VSRDLPAGQLASLRGEGAVYIAEAFDAVYTYPETGPDDAPGEPETPPPSDGNWILPIAVSTGVETEPEWVVDDPRFFGHWEGVIDGRPTFFEQGPGWNEVEDAVAWGRERSRRVLVRFGLGDPVHYSAGEEPFEPGDIVIRPWPPAEHS
jgi:hypothetical protein